MLISIIIGILFIVLVLVAVYKTVRNRRNGGDSYTPFDNITRGVQDDVSREPLKEEQTYIEPRVEQRKEPK